ncbi:MAG TPA: UDP-N-acetylmuramoyl-L-alanine--D-glutamate ligase, partial [Spirochaetota bacterium]|nr:UDP-N-acetylmuramoyl-L-alanine--D-glutamate ligase [Spirochaetota bacterium]
MALASLTRPAVLILGGRTKGDDYARLNGPIAQRVKRLLLIGESTPEFARLFAAHDPVPVATLEEALAQAMRHSAPGDAVLYSPATASFDMFRNYEERGDRFRETFQRLVRGEIAWT